jgi:hypothetical protein
MAFRSGAAGAQSRKLQSGGSMISQHTVIPRAQVIQVLSHLRLEWGQAADGCKLTDLNANVGLLLADFAAQIGLSQDEQVQALGAELVNDLQDKLLSTPSKNGRH